MVIFHVRKCISSSDQTSFSFLSQSETVKIVWKKYRKTTSVLCGVSGETNCGVSCNQSAAQLDSEHLTNHFTAHK